ncbi:MAG: hypothetical protein WB689_36225 [Xanthobacteraceae bacterium]
MLMDLLSKAATVAMLSFVVSSMLAMGTGLTVAQIIEPLRNIRLVLLALLANFLLMPAGAVALAKVLRLDEPFGVGLLLLGCAAGAPFLPKLAELAKGNLAFAVGVMVLLMVDHKCPQSIRQGYAGKSSDRCQQTDQDSVRSDLYGPAKAQHRK